MKKVIIVGAGAAGMMAACRAAECGAEVLLLEKNEKTGKKLFITGKGRCNLTNACDTEELFANIVHNRKFLYSAFYGFSNFMTMEFFEKNGCPLKTERGNRVFPLSDHSSDIIRTLERHLKAHHVTIRLHTKVREISVRDGRVDGVILEQGERIEGDAVILAAGGLSYPSTGSTGEGYVMAKQWGHSIVETAPSLVPLVVREPEPRELQGLALKKDRKSVV